MTAAEDKLNAFLGKAIGDLGASVSAVLMLIGDELGLYTALAGHRLSEQELAQKTGTNARYIREWLANQAAGGYVEYDEADDTYYLTAEQELCLADPKGPVDLAGAYQIVQDLFYVRDRAVENFRSGSGMEWGEHHRCLFYGTERFFRAGYNANLVASWLPALDGVVEKLAAGGKAADVGCGHGASTILMAQAFPSSQFVGIDYHGEWGRGAGFATSPDPSQPNSHAELVNWPGSSLVGQIGVLVAPNGGMIVVALAARPDSGKFDDGTTDLTTMASWLNANLEALPAGQHSL